MGFLQTGLQAEAGFVLHGVHEATMGLEPSSSITDTGFEPVGCAVALNTISNSSFMLAKDAHLAIGFVTYEPYAQPHTRSVALFKNGLQFVAKTFTGSNGILKGTLISIDNGMFIPAVAGMLSIGYALEDAMDHTGGYGTFPMVIKFSTTTIGA